MYIAGIWRTENRIANSTNIVAIYVFLFNFLCDLKQPKKKKKHIVRPENGSRKKWSFSFLFGFASQCMWTLMAREWEWMVATNTNVIKFNNNNGKKRPETLNHQTTSNHYAFASPLFLPQKSFFLLFRFVYDDYVELDAFTIQISFRFLFWLCVTIFLFERFFLRVYTNFAPLLFYSSLLLLLYGYLLSLHSFFLRCLPNADCNTHTDIQPNK